MSPAQIIRFPQSLNAIWVMPDDYGGWLVLAGEHGWLVGSEADAGVEANWLSRNMRLPIREVRS